MTCEKRRCIATVFNRDKVGFEEIEGSFHGFFPVTEGDGWMGVYGLVEEIATGKVYYVAPDKLKFIV